MREFDDLVAVLEDDRPVIDPAFARELDQRAAAGFPRRRRLRLSPLGYLAVPAVGLAVAAFVIAGLPKDPGATTHSFSSGSAGAVATAPPETKQQPAARDSAAAPVAKALRGRVQEQTAGLTLTAPGGQLAELGDRVIAVADQVGGFVLFSSVSTTSGGDYQLRVPVARLDDALARLSRLGHVSERAQGSQDITAERNAARDRFDESVAERRSLLARLGRATTDNEVASLKARLRDVNAAIATGRAALERVLRRARYASVRVTLQARQGAIVPVDDGRWTPGDALRDAGRVLEVAAGVAVVVASVLVPLAGLAVLLLAAGRIAGRRGRDRMLESV